VYRNFLFTLLLAAFLSCSLPAGAERPPVTDPTAPPYSVATPAARSNAGTSLPLLLHSTRIAYSSRSAVISNRSVVIGSRIDGAVVTKIEQGQVTLARGSETIVLRLLLPPVKRPAKDAE